MDTEHLIHSYAGELIYIKSTHGVLTLTFANVIFDREMY